MFLFFSLVCEHFLVLIFFLPICIMFLVVFSLLFFLRQKDNQFCSFSFGTHPIIKMFAYTFHLSSNSKMVNISLATHFLYMFVQNMHAFHMTTISCAILCVKSVMRNKALQCVMVILCKHICHFVLNAGFLLLVR